MNKRKLAAILLLALLDDDDDEHIPKRTKRRFWSSECFLQRDAASDSPLPEELSIENPEAFKEELRMTDECYTRLLNLVRPYITKKTTVMRATIGPEPRLMATLTYLATGKSFEHLKRMYRISPQALGVIIPETCAAVIQALKDYMRLPSTKEGWQRVARGFSDSLDFPNCGGCLTGKHVRITPSSRKKSEFLNYGGFHSVVLLALVNADLEFMMVDTGFSDGGEPDDKMVENSRLIRNLAKTLELNMPSSSETVEGLNFVFVADDSFGLRPNVLKSFPDRLLDCYDKRVFNYRVSRARRCAENALGLLGSRFGIFNSAICLSPWKINLVVKCCCVLHNFLLKFCRECYAPTGSVDVEDVRTGTVIKGEWRGEKSPLCGLRLTSQDHSVEAGENRLRYVDYFFGPGAVDWQQDKVL